MVTGARYFLGVAGAALLWSAPAAAMEPGVGAADPRVITAAPAMAGGRVPIGRGPEALNWFGGCGWGWGGCFVPAQGGGGLLAGVLAVGAIAVIASVIANNRDREVNRVERPPRIEQRRTQGLGSGLDRAVDMCVQQVDRGSTRSAGVENASRTVDGWRVTGTLRQGGGQGGRWNCWIDNEGRVRQVDFGAGGEETPGNVGAVAPGSADPQLSSEAYALAREGLRAEQGRLAPGAEAEGVDGGAPASQDLWVAPADRPDRPLVDPDAPLPAYPGGPLPGEEGYEEAVAAQAARAAAAR